MSNVDVDAIRDKFDNFKDDLREITNDYPGISEINLSPEVSYLIATIIQYHLDKKALLALIETMRAETDRLAAECARLTPANILAGIRANETIAAQDNEIVELRSQLAAAEEWNAGLSAALERRPAQGVHVNDGAAQEGD